NTGRPAVPEDYVSLYDIPIGAWQSSLGNDSHYLDDGYTPLYPFGYGLSYSQVAYGAPTLDKEAYATTDKISVQVEVTHQGGPEVTEVVQCYVRDHFGSITRPVAELVAFERVALAPGETQTVTIEVPVSQLAYWSPDNGWAVEPGTFSLWVGPDCRPGEVVEFTVE
ncbi:MAG TPA: glycosyl hydrolase, partial [Cytophagales bacterium]|nr:glycosyl hydrolase [Cytophagales bacterium]